MTYPVTAGGFTCLYAVLGHTGLVLQWHSSGIAAGAIFGLVIATVRLIEEAIMLAIVAAVLFLIALVLELATLAFGVVDAFVFITAGLVCLALHLAGVGSSSMRGWLRSRI